jgi:hypothetical protein
VHLSDAQRRHPRAGTGTGWRSPYHGHGYYPGYYGGYYHGYYGGYYPGYYYGGWYPSFGLGFYYGNGYPYYGGYGYYEGYPVYGRPSGSLRILVDPPNTRVYVDGYYAGVVDDFDGLFQRLHLAAGRHEIILRLDGYETQRFRVYMAADNTIKIRHDMVKGSGESSQEVVLGDQEAAEAVARGDDGRGQRGSDEVDDETPSGSAHPWRRAPAEEVVDALKLNVQPDDASVYVDGSFQGSARQARYVDLTPGRHHVEVVRPGYRTFEADVEVEPGKTAELNARLER